MVPEELQVRLNAAPELEAAFEALTPGRRKSYIFHVSGAKQQGDEPVQHTATGTSEKILKSGHGVPPSSPGISV